jgi:hypothetical protein
MGIKFTKKGSVPDFPFVIRHHIWPGHVIIGFQAFVCHCKESDGKQGEYCIQCGGAIPTEKESKIFKLK